MILNAERAYKKFLLDKEKKEKTIRITKYSFTKIMVNSMKCKVKTLIDDTVVHFRIIKFRHAINNTIAE